MYGFQHPPLFLKNVNKLFQNQFTHLTQSILLHNGHYQLQENIQISFLKTNVKLKHIFFIPENVQVIIDLNQCCIEMEPFHDLEFCIFQVSKNAQITIRNGTLKCIKAKCIKALESQHIHFQNIKFENFGNHHVLDIEKVGKLMIQDCQFVSTEIPHFDFENYQTLHDFYMKPNISKFEFERLKLAIPPCSSSTINSWSIPCMIFCKEVQKMEIQNVKFQVTIQPLFDRCIVFYDQTEQKPMQMIHLEKCNQVLIKNVEMTCQNKRQIQPRPSYEHWKGFDMYGIVVKECSVLECRQIKFHEMIAEMGNVHGFHLEKCGLAKLIQIEWDHVQAGCSELHRNDLYYDPQAVGIWISQCDLFHESLIFRNLSSIVSPLCLCIQEFPLGKIQLISKQL